MRPNGVFYRDVAMSTMSRSSANAVPSFRDRNVTERSSWPSESNRTRMSENAARRPQQKGRIERLWGTLQSSLVVKIRLRGIRTVDEANAFFPAVLEVGHNERFAVAAKDAKSAFPLFPERKKLGSGKRDSGPVYIPKQVGVNDGFHEA